jgi:glycosyltransferase involved in cell wall biosynthesis
LKTKLSDNINPPLVSICVPAYNCGKYIGETLSCLCSQTYTNIEIIVVNDGATDETLKNASSNSDHRISIINVVNGGASKARNIAYQHAAGRYIVFFDADDYIESGFIDQQLQKINNSDDEIVLAAWGRFYNNNRSSFRAEPMPFSEMTFD